MKIELKVKKEFDAKFIKVDAGVRYWEDGTVNGVDDHESGTPKMPFAVPTDEEHGYRWQPLIDIETGKIVDWPQGTKAYCHYKVCDDGTYSILDANKEVIASANSYVPDVLCPAESGYGDSIIMSIDENGVIEDWSCDADDLLALIRDDFNYEDD